MQSFLVASLAAVAAAAPIVERQAAPPPAGVNDAVILNYALTLEHLEAAFYREALQKFTAADFKKAGLPASFYNNLQEIASDEATHVTTLTQGLSDAGATPVAECTYAFGLTDVPTFLAIANVLEGVGVSAYLGAAQYIADPAYLTAAGSILTVEARHSAYLRDHQNPAQSPFPAAFDIPLDFDEVFSLAAPFITSCPSGPSSSLETLPFKAFPAISAAPAGVAQKGDSLTLTVAQAVDATNAFFITSTGPIPAELQGSGTTYTATVPADAQAGQAYLVLTSSSDEPTDDNTVAGPAVIQIADNAFGRAPDTYPCTNPKPYGKPHPKPYGKPKPTPKPYQHKPKPKPYHKPEHKPSPPAYQPAPPAYGH